MHPNIAFGLYDQFLASDKHDKCARAAMIDANKSESQGYNFYVKLTKYYCE